MPRGRRSRCSPSSPSARRTGSARAVEIEALMGLLEEYIAREAEQLRERGVRVRILGRPGPAGAERTPRRRAGHGRHRGRRPSSRSTCASPTAPAPRSPARPAGWREEVAAGRLDPAEIDEEAVGAAAAHRAVARSRSPDPHLRRDADLQLPALAAGLRRAVRHARPLARFHPAASLRGDPGVPAARSALRPRYGLMASNDVRRVVFARGGHSRSRFCWSGTAAFPSSCSIAAAPALGDSRALRSGASGSRCVRPWRSVS